MIRGTIVEKVRQICRSIFTDVKFKDTEYCLKRANSKTCYLETHHALSLSIVFLNKIRKKHQPACFPLKTTANRKIMYMLLLCNEL